MSRVAFGSQSSRALIRLKAASATARPFATINGKNPGGVLYSSPALMAALTASLNSLAKGATLATSFVNLIASLSHR